MVKLRRGRSRVKIPERDDECGQFVVLGPAPASIVVAAQVTIVKITRHRSVWCKMDTNILLGDLCCCENVIYLVC